MLRWRWLEQEKYQFCLILVMSCGAPYTNLQKGSTIYCLIQIASSWDFADEGPWKKCKFCTVGRTMDLQQSRQAS